MLFWGLGLSGYASEIWVFPAGAACLILTLAHASAVPGNPLHWRGFQIAFVADARDVPPIAIGAFLLLTLAASALLHYKVERPGRHWAQGFRQRVRAGAASPQP